MHTRLLHTIIFLCGAQYRAVVSLNNYNKQYISISPRKYNDKISNIIQITTDVNKYSFSLAICVAAGVFVFLKKCMFVKMLVPKAAHPPDVFVTQK